MSEVILKFTAGSTGSVLESTSELPESLWEVPYIHRGYNSVCDSVNYRYIVGFSIRHIYFCSSWVDYNSKRIISSRKILNKLKYVQFLTIYVFYLFHYLVCEIYFMPNVLLFPVNVYKRINTKH